VTAGSVTAARSGATTLPSGRISRELRRPTNGLLLSYFHAQREQEATLVEGCDGATRDALRPRSPARAGDRGRSGSQPIRCTSWLVSS
jgi:hypothetical protein